MSSDEEEPPPFKEISPKKENQNILRGLKNKNSKVDFLHINKFHSYDTYYQFTFSKEDEDQYAKEFKWLGFYIGRSEVLKTLQINRPDITLGQWQTYFASLAAGINCNRSINKLTFRNLDLSDGSVISNLVPFFENNSQLSEVSLADCQMSQDGFTVMIGGFNKCPNLKTINISVRINDITNEDHRSIYVTQAFRILGLGMQTTINLNINGYHDGYQARASPEKIELRDLKIPLGTAMFTGLRRFVGNSNSMAHIAIHNVKIGRCALRELCLIAKNITSLSSINMQRLSGMDTATLDDATIVDVFSDLGLGNMHASPTVRICGAPFVEGNPSFRWNRDNRDKSLELSSTSLDGQGLDLASGSLFFCYMPAYLQRATITKLTLHQCSFGVEGIRKLSYGIGGSETLKQLSISSSSNDDIVDLFEGIIRCQSLAQVIFDKVQMGKCRPTEISPQLFKRHANLAKIDIKANLRSEGLRQLALTVGRCAVLTHFSLVQLDAVVDIDDGLVEVFVGLSMAPNLEELKFNTLGQSGGRSIGHKSCQALSTLLHWSVPNLRHLEIRAILSDITAGDLCAGLAFAAELQSFELHCWSLSAVAVRALCSSIICLAKLNKLTLGSRILDLQCLRIFGDLLRKRDCRLIDLTLPNHCGDSGARIISRALSRNTILERLQFVGRITNTGLGHFTRMLCNDKSLTSIVRSNHSLQKVNISANSQLISYNSKFSDLLRLNSFQTKRSGDTTTRQRSILKILYHHYIFDVELLLQWELKMMPLFLSWLEEARDCPVAYDDRKQTRDHKLKIKHAKWSATYQFIRGSPGHFVEGITRQYLAEFGKEKMKLHYEHVFLKKDKTNKLKKIEDDISRAQRRLF